MRKHFLLLFLMALLPLAGWAAPISETDIIARSPYYGYLPAVTATGLTEGVHFEVVAYYTDATMETEVSATNVKKTAAGTDLVVLVRGLGAYDGTVKLSFQIKKNALTIVGVAKSKEYGAADPTGNDFFEVTEVTDAAEEDVTAALAAKITFGRVSGNDKGEYAYTASFTGDNASLAGNYTIASADIKKEGATPGTYVQAQFEITAKTFNTTNINVADITGVYTYNGDQFKPAVTVNDITLAATPTPLELDKDYTVTYGVNTNAGAGTVTVKGKGNYSDATIVKNFTINKAPLVVTPVLSKDYNGTTALPETTVASFTFQGWKKDDSNALVTAYPANDELTVTSPAIYAGTYTLTIDDVDDFTITGNNYKILKQNGTFTINKIDLAINVTDEEKAYGVAPDKAITQTGTTIVIGLVDDWTLIQDVVEVTVAETPEASGDHKDEYKMTPAAKANPYEAETADYNTFEAKLKTLNSYNVTWNPGYLTITKAPLYVGLDETKYTTLSKTYDGEVVSLTAPTMAQLLVTGLLGEDTAAGVLKGTPGIEVENNGAKAGTYNIQVTGLTADNYEIVPITSQYKINQKALKIKVFDQVFVTSSTTAAKLNNLYEIDATDGLILTDKADEVFKLDFVAAVKDDMTDGKFTAVPATAGWVDGVFANGIDAVASNTDPTKTKWGNYDVDVTLGKVTVVASGEYTFVLDDTKDLSTVVTTDKNGATVTFTSRPLYAETWNALVLPFEIAVKDLAAAFDYAVVDVLDQDATDGNVHFRLKVSGKIPAHTPFLIYPCGTYNNLNQVTFTGVNVKKITDNVPVPDDGGNKFIGVYKETSIFGSDKLRYLGSDGKFYGTSKYPSTNPAKIKPLRAYLDLTGSVSARPTIFIEEPDGSTTAISTINADGVAVPAQGWYTINGMKLEGMPTEKGIYINNGKKVVIK